jgi:hypothetical protein
MVSNDEARPSDKNNKKQTTKRKQCVEGVGGEKGRGGTAEEETVKNAKRKSPPLPSLPPTNQQE